MVQALTMDKEIDNTTMVEVFCVRTPGEKDADAARKKATSSAHGVERKSMLSTARPAAGIDGGDQRHIISSL